MRHDAAPVIVALRHVSRFNTRMPDTGIDFSAPATLRKCPSLNKQLVSASLGARPYMIGEATLDECIQQFMQLREAQRHLYEIHTEPQKERAKVLGQQLHKAALRSRTPLIEAAILDAENDIMARISERL